jgi:hypothetical protein
METCPAGAEAMKRLRDRIDYQFKPIKDGARVTITTKDAEALAAVHEFIRYQIKEHRTSDSVG